MKVGIVGAGLIVPDFLKAVEQINGLRVVGISGLESDLEMMKKLQDKHGIDHIYTDYKRMLDSDIEIVYVAVPNHLHYIFTKQALEAQKHVILEKPFASSLTQAQELVELAQAKHVILFEAISNQYLPNYEKTKALLPSLGDVKIVQLNYSQYSRRYDLFKAGSTLPVFDPKKSGGALMDLNVYNIHFVLGLFGKPTEICYLANIEKGIDTSGILTMTYDTFKCVLVAAKDCQSPVAINIQGDKGYIHSEVPSNVYSEFSFANNGGKPEKYALNEGKHRLFFELDYFRQLVETNNLEKAKELNQKSLAVMEILDAARTQVGIEI